MNRGVGDKKNKRKSQWDFPFYCTRAKAELTSIVVPVLQGYFNSFTAHFYQNSNIIIPCIRLNCLGRSVVLKIEGM